MLYSFDLAVETVRYVEIFHSVNDDDHHHDHYDEYDGYDDYGGDDVRKVMKFYIDGERKNSLFI